MEGERRICKICKVGYERYKNRCRKTIEKFTADCRSRYGPDSFESSLKAIEDFADIAKQVPFQETVAASHGEHLLSRTVK